MQLCRANDLHTSSAYMIYIIYYWKVVHQYWKPVLPASCPGWPSRKHSDLRRIDTFEKTMYCLIQFSCQFFDSNMMGLVWLCWEFTLNCHAGCIAFGFHQFTLGIQQLGNWLRSERNSLHLSALVTPCLHVCVPHGLDPLWLCPKMRPTFYSFGECQLWCDLSWTIEQMYTSSN